MNKYDGEMSFWIKKNQFVLWLNNLKKFELTREIFQIQIPTFDHNSMDRKNKVISLFLNPYLQFD